MCGCLLWCGLDVLMVVVERVGCWGVEVSELDVGVSKWDVL